MPPSSRKHAVLTALAAVSLALALGGGRHARAQPAPTSAFVGAKTCAECHARVAHRWTSGRHSKMAQPATAASVLGDFAKGEITLRGERYRLRAQDGGYFIQEQRVDFTLGNRRIQHYLTRRADGWIVVLPPTWDVVRREWFHNMEIVRPDEKHVNGVQIWNKNCDGCHVSQ